ncbi:MAG TPA: O-antigen ligase family protein [Flavobacteriaceae bacterium]|nr:O-antigen ligase family protein [Flavobacteriaceae bacterium]
MKVNFLKLIPYAAFLMAFFLPLHTGASNLFLILVFVTSFFAFIFNKCFVKRSLKNLIFTLFPFFILYSIGIFYSDPPFYGTKILGQTIAFFLCPLLLLFLPENTLEKTRKSLMKGIVTGAVLSVTLLLINAILNYYATRPFPSLDGEFLGFYYTYHKFTEPFIEFAAYLGAYVVMAIAVLFYRVFKKKKLDFASFCSLMMLSIGVVFINARIIILLFLILVVTALAIGFIRLLRQKKYLSLSVLLITVIVMTAGTYKALSESFIETRLNEELQWELSNQKDTGYNREMIGDSRIPRWHAAMRVISKQPVFGHGTYMEKKVLANQYEKDKLWSSLKNRYDAHNMYLSFGIEYGIIGVLLYLFFLISNFYYAVKNKDLLFFFFVTMVATISIFESYLLNNAGITYVALFMTVFLYSNLFKCNSIRK